MKKTFFFIGSLFTILTGCASKSDMALPENTNNHPGNLSVAQHLMPVLPATYPVDINATAETKHLYANMKSLSLKGVMFGHQDDLAVGIGWKYAAGRSDIKETAGQFPAVVGWDLGKIELGQAYNFYGVHFDKIREYARTVYRTGGVNTISWHSFNPVDTTQSSKGTLVDSTINKLFANTVYLNRYKTWLDKIATFMLSLTADNGELIPVIFRPFHELNGDWFWWGRSHCSPEEYIQLWRFTVDYLRNTKGVHNLLFAYSTDKFYAMAEYMERYPGDDYVDIMGFDTYDKAANHPGNTFVTQATAMVGSLRTLAMQRNKLWAITETGIPLVPVSDWWTQTLLPIIRNSGLSYSLVWINLATDNFWAAYAGHASAPDMLSFYGQTGPLFLDKVTPENIYAAHEQLFGQQFDSSSVLTDYIDSNPDNTRFNSIGGTGAGTVAGINAGKLRFDRTANADNGYFSRTKDFSPLPAVIQYRFDLTVSGNTTGTTQQKVALFQVGSGFTTVNNALTGTPVENNALVHSRIGIDFGLTPGQFSMRDIGAAVSSATFSGTQTITWIINHATQHIYYTAPNGTSAQLAANKSDLWVGTVKVFSGIAAVTSTQQLSDLKFAFTAGTGIIDIDNMVMTDFPG